MVDVRALQTADASWARARIIAQFGGTRYEERTLGLLDGAFAFKDVFGVVAGDESLMLCQKIEGAMSVLRIDLLFAPRSYCADMIGACVNDTRVVYAECPDDSPYAIMSDALVGAGFTLESRAADLIADGIDLLIYTRRSNA